MTYGDLKHDYGECGEPDISSIEEYTIKLSKENVEHLSNLRKRNGAGVLNGGAKKEVAALWSIIEQITPESSSPSFKIGTMV